MFGHDCTFKKYIVRYMELGIYMKTILKMYYL